MKEPFYLSIKELKELLKEKKLTPKELLGIFKERIEKWDSKIKSFVRVNFEKAFKEAETKKEGKLAYIPFAVKDNICIKGEEITCCSKILKGFIPPYEATVIERLKKEGAIIIGITNMDEFAFGSSTENSCYYPTHNPFDLERVPGGSSGGSAASVCAGFVPFALGSDTGGSIRQPASFCGVVGFKPTYGRVSRYGLIAFGSSLDQISPLTRRVQDCALILNIISGKDEKDSTSVEVEVPDFETEIETEIKGLKVGLPKEYFVSGIQEEVREKVLEGVKVLEKLGVAVREISLPHTKYAIPAYYIVAPSEASSNLSRFDGVQYGLRIESQDLKEMYEETRGQGFGLEAKRRILLGTFCLSSGFYQAYYLKGLKTRTLIKRDFESVFKEVDLIITPTSPTVAFKLGERIKDPLSMYLSDVFTVPVNLAGLPAVSIPCGLSEENLPIGMQIIGPAFRENLIFRVAFWFERETEFYKEVKPNF